MKCPEIDEGELLLVKNGELKEELYETLKNNPNRVFRGEKDVKE